ncbi:ankyrin repeat-containing domain protein [Stachybotrys elegans]|uniref:Ankyrin repeat-containing domain protein n=1 Tax=Stachybotrys elegans TaxID=80388 RepID=A0A8K0T1S3_9HYPO|nr:ankyrin repeat-containing domain protein [Stachybotrys elegans]
MASMELDLPQIPAPHRELAKYIAVHPEKSMIEIMEPYRKYEAQLRSVYAQDRQNPILEDPYINVVPLFTEDTKLITTRARDLASESDEEKSRYIMPLPEDKRRPHGSPATVADVDEFRKQFNVFSETSLVDMDWSNVVAAGSSVINCLLPIPAEFKTTKRKMREYYHEKFCPASDVDLFLYGLTHEQAIEKIKQIEQAIRDALLNEVTVVRTKYALTIASQYPVRHIQIVLRVYKSVSEILTGFDIDAAGGAYDGKQVYVTPRALASFITQINHVDLTRRSPSYENRLSKYSHRNFEVYWPELDRSRVDPTIFERSFQRTLGLARLLVLERLPTTSARETYLNKRRQERGRPTTSRGYMNRLGGNLKDYHEDEIADWLSEEDISNYHTFTVPYGEKFNAKRIEKLCYTRDLLLNAEWNQSAERKVYLHRHPAFFGRVEDVIEDCCGSCPEAKTAEEIEVAEKEAEIYISGKVSFLIDDPGRQQIGSFNPLTEQDWTDMAYVGNTARLCQSIVDGDVDDILNWLSQEGADPNKRDYTGRTPLHLAVMASTTEVVRCLVDHGARLTARLADGKTALHLAASLGHSEMIKILMEKSIANEEAEEEKQERRRKAAKEGGVGESQDTEGNASEQGSMEVDDGDGTKDSGESDSDEEVLDYDESEADVVSMATGSFVNVKPSADSNQDLLPEESDDEPDYYQIDVLAWDVPCSPLHLAIVGGHEETVKLLCDYGADSILPIKFLNSDPDETAAILTLTLALALPLEKAKSMAQLLLKLGATCAQADAKGCTALHQYIKNGGMESVDLLCESDPVGLKSAINHLVFTGWRWNLEAISPLHTAIDQGDSILVLRLLNAGAKAHIDFDTWLKAAKVSSSCSSNLGDLETNKKQYNETLEQPLIAAVYSGNPDVALELLRNGADPNTLTSIAQSLLFNEYKRRYNKGETVLDIVRHLISKLATYSAAKPSYPKPQEVVDAEGFLQKFKPGTYQHWIVSRDIEKKQKRYEKDLKIWHKQKAAIDDSKEETSKNEAIKDLISGLQAVESMIIDKGGKTFEGLHPDIKTSSYESSGNTEAQESKQAPYSYNFSFLQDKGMSEARRDGYIELMEAAWAGNGERIKELTLQAWGADQDQPPLKIAVMDSESNSPFSVAFLRGHQELSRAVLDIVAAQWSPEKDEKRRYTMRNDDDTDEDDEDYGSEEDSDAEVSDPRIVSEKVDKTFTIDNIGQVSMQVESHTKPLKVICDRVLTFQAKENEAVCDSGVRTLFQHVLRNDDSPGLKFLLDLAQHFSAQKLNGDTDPDESGGNFTFPQADFKAALAENKPHLLGIIIKRTGAGIPLDHLVKKSGVEVKAKSKYYQGLTVYGKKRKDWATAGRNMVTRTTDDKTPPLLHAAVGGNVELVEFFLGDAPHRLYSEFGKSKAAREDFRLRHLKDSPGGFDRAISKWLGADNDLVIHCAIMVDKESRSEELLRYLVQACPEFIEKRSTAGDTPLLAACRLGRPNLVKILLGANADQSAKNHKGENILHAAIAGNPQAFKLRKLLDLLDADFRSHLFLQRKNLQENGTTPLHEWISNQYSNTRRIIDSKKPQEEQDDTVDTLKLLLEYSKGEELEMLNGAGDTCLHTAIMKDTLWIAKTLIDFRPQLLYRENAVGRTPAEVAHDRLLAEQLKKPEQFQRRAYGYNRQDKAERVIERRLEKIQGSAEGSVTAEQLGLGGDYAPGDLIKVAGAMGILDPVVKNRNLKHPALLLRQAMWDMCNAAMTKNPGVRRLVSLNEANDVARRLGEKFASSRYFGVTGRRGDDDDRSSDGEEDGKGGKKPTIDFAAQLLSNSTNAAWHWDDDSDNEDDGKMKEAWCSNCLMYHD